VSLLNALMCSPATWMNEPSIHRIDRVRHEEHVRSTKQLARDQHPGDRHRETPVPTRGTIPHAV